MAELQLRNLTKRFPGHVAVDDVSLSIASGELFCLLGPSGCGKSTTLQLVCGLQAPENGTVHLDGRDITSTPAQKRNIGVVFQNFALFPHMTARENVAYGLRVRRRPKDEIHRRVSELLELVGLQGKESRYPRNLSGGEQQRVAVARALAIEPALLLLDEPFSSLDRELRLELRTELARVQRETRVTTVFVTHDQDEAFAIADTVGIMNRGHVQQVGAARTLYETPANEFVARFIGRSNILTGTVGRRPDGAYLHFAERELPLGSAVPAGVNGTPRRFLIRPERITLAPPRPDDTPAVEGLVTHIEYGGDSMLYYVRALDHDFLIAGPADPRAPAVSPGDRTYLTWSPDDVYLVPDDHD